MIRSLSGTKTPGTKWERNQLRCSSAAPENWWPTEKYLYIILHKALQIGKTCRLNPLQPVFIWVIFFNLGLSFSCCKFPILPHSPNHRLPGAPILQDPNLSFPLNYTFITFRFLELFNCPHCQSIFPLKASWQTTLSLSFSLFPHLSLPHSCLAIYIPLAPLLVYLIRLTPITCSLFVLSFIFPLFV